MNKILEIEYLLGDWKAAERAAIAFKCDSVKHYSAGVEALEAALSILKRPSNKAVEHVCAECGSYCKWWVTCWRCRNLDCRAEYPHNG